MSYEFETTAQLLAALELIGSNIGDLDSSLSETYEWPADDDFYGTYGNEMSFDSMSTFDSNDFEYMQNLMY